MKIAKIAVAILYAATVFVVLKEFSGHGHHEPDKHQERDPSAISTRLVAGAKGLFLKAKDGVAKTLQQDLRLYADRPLFAALLLTAVIDTASHEHPVDHKQLKPRRRGRRFTWKEPQVWHALLAKLRLKPSPGNLLGHRLHLMRYGQATVII
jgi:hypothetical protein